MRRIMIIDSDLEQMRILKEALAGEYLTLGCNRGTNALDLFEIFQPSALILDPKTHDLSGKEFIRKIKSLTRGTALPILALSRLTNLRSIEESLGWEANALFSKPCSADRIKKKLDQYWAVERAPTGAEPSGV